MVKAIHIVVMAVSSLDDAKHLYVDGLGLRLEKPEGISPEGHVAMKVSVGDSFLEMCQPIESKGLVGKFIERSGQGLYGLSLEVEDLQRAVDRLRANGIEVVASGSDTAEHLSYAFIPRRSACGALIQLVQRFQGINSEGGTR